MRGLHHRRDSYRKNRYCNMLARVTAKETQVAYALTNSNILVSASVVYFVSRNLRTLWPKDPGNAPSRQTETLGKAVNNQDVVLIHVFHILSRGNRSSVTVAGVVVSGIELVTYKGGAAATNVLNLGQLRVGNDTPGRIARVRGQDDRGATGDFLGNLVGVDMVAIFLGQRDRNSSKLGGSRHVSSRYFRN